MGITMKILLTAFDPFGGEDTNPALEAVLKIRATIADANIIKLTVPTAFDKSIETVYQAMKKEKPDVVVCIGQAGGRYDITPERIAININDARIPDNLGSSPIDTTIFADGQNAYFSNLPVKAMVKAIQEGGLPASLSNTAGTFVCNHLMYGVLYYIDKEFPNTRGGFIHVPFLPNQAAKRNSSTPSMSLSCIIQGLELALEAIINNCEDITLSAGTLH